MDRDTFTHLLFDTFKGESDKNGGRVALNTPRVANLSNHIAWRSLLTGHVTIHMTSDTSGHT
jgi:hypothetical protein